MFSYTDNNKILYVDDEEQLLRSFLSLMRKEKYEITTLQNSNSIETILNEKGPFALILSDQKMPDYDGVRVLEICKNKYPDSIRVLVTGYADQKDTIRALNIGGISSYIAKPWEDNELKIKIREWVSHYNLKIENQLLLSALDVENEKLNNLLEGTVAQTVKVLGDIASHVSPQLASFGERVKQAGNSFLKHITGITTEERWAILRALDLFNLGITLLPLPLQAAINKDGLSVLQKSSVAGSHHLLAAGLLKNIPRFEPVARVIELQSKNFDGTGEPKSEHISGTNIPLGARLLHILINLIEHEAEPSRYSERLLKMENHPTLYDVNLIHLIRIKESEESFKSGEGFLPVSRLKPGMLILKDIKTINSHQLLLKAGSILTETFINILQQWHKRDPIEEPVQIKI